MSEWVWIFVYLVSHQSNRWRPGCKSGFGLCIDSIYHGDQRSGHKSPTVWSKSRGITNVRKASRWCLFWALVRGRLCSFRDRSAVIQLLAGPLGLGRVMRRLFSWILLWFGWGAGFGAVWFWCSLRTTGWRCRLIRCRRRRRWQLG